jgi:hypothetical protein
VPAVYQIRFHPGGEVREFYGSRGDYYGLEDGSQIEVRSGPVWCHRCGGFTHGESIEPPEEIDRQIADLRDPESELFRFFQAGGTGSLGVGGIRFIMELEARRRWLMGRKSPPKCLECGSADIVVLPEGQEIRNPTGPGRVEVTVTGLCSTSFNNRFYTPEGDRIPRDTKPTYWSLPG